MNKLLTSLIAPRAMADRPRSAGAIITLIGGVCLAYTVFAFISTIDEVYLLPIALTGLAPWGIWLLIFGFPIDANEETPRWYLVGALTAFFVGATVGLVAVAILVGWLPLP